YAVLYKIKKAAENGQLYIGILTDVQQDGSVLRFSTKHFGSFQAISLAKPLTEAREVKTIGTIATKSNETELAGLWAAPCNTRKESRDGETWEESNVQYLRVTGDQLHFREFSYSGANCKTPWVTYSVTAKLKIGDYNKVVTDAKNLDITFEQTYIAPASLDLVKTLNEKKVCGFKDWRVGEQKAMTTACEDELDALG